MLRSRGRKTAQTHSILRNTRLAARPLQLEPLEGRLTPAGIVAMTSPPGSAAVVTVLDAETGQQKFTLNPYPGFTGGVNAAVGDVNADGTPDIVTGTGAGGGAIVSVFSGVDGTPIASFLAGDMASRSGVSVAAADFDADGRAEIVVASVRNGQPFVEILRGADGSSIREVTPFAGSAGISVAAGDFNGDGTADVMVGAGPGDAPRVVVLDGKTYAILFSQFVFEQTFTGGVRLSAADLDGDGKVEVTAAARFLGGPRVQAFKGGSGDVFQNFFAYNQELRDGVFAVAVDVDRNGTIDLMTRDGSGQTAKAFDGRTLAQLSAGSYSDGLPASTAYDHAAPTVTVTSTATSTTRDNPIHFTATFSEGVSGFAVTDLQVTNGKASNLVQVDGRTYTFDITPNGGGAVTVTVSAGAATDSAGNISTASAAVSRTFSAVTVNALTTNDTTPTLTGTVTAAGSGVTVTVGAQTITATVSGTTWTATVPSPLLEGTYTVVATETGSAGTSTGSGTLVVDATAPTATVSSSATETTSTTPIPFTVEFNEDVTGFEVSDLSITNGAASAFTAVNARKYTFNVAPTTSGAVTVSVATGKASDTAGNTNAASNALTRTFNPTGSITVTANALTTGDTTPTLTGTVSNAASTVVVTVNTQQVTANVSGTNWTATIPNALPEGTYNIQVSATAGTNTGSTTLTDGLVIDTTAPAASLSTTATSPTNDDAILFTINFGEVVSGFELADLTVVNGLASNLAPGAAVGSFTFSIAPVADGVVRVSLAANKAQDAAGNQNTAAAEVAVTSDRTVPATPGVGGLDPASDSGSSSTDGITSDTTPTFVGAGETGSTVELFADNGAGVVSLGTTVVVGGAWAVTPSTALADGTYTVRAVATDAAGNTSPTSGPFSLVLDTALPTAAIDATAPTAVTGIANGNGSSVASVLVSIYDSVNDRYWDQNTGTFSSSTELPFQATITPGTGNAVAWSLPYSGPGGTFDVRAVVTDVAGNEASETASVVFGTL